MTLIERAAKLIQPDELAATPLIVREPGSGTRITLDGALVGRDVAAPALELNSNDAVKISAAAGVGPAVLSQLAVASALGTGELVSIPVVGLPLTRTLNAVWDAHHRPRGSALKFLQLVRGRHTRSRSV